ncbi:hypothetical protein DPMN_037097 [Dreissena polymorpha]|uniref:Uncharacterized protein n=1 Tax=Dreissena polymorpha TaxID=45954 RepID=A0A9D4RPH5_DREPO|nr:hypothetical protein DPMN_037097 [Dreissena polymorpha]
MFELFHDDQTFNVASSILISKNAPSPGGNVLKATKTIFKLIQDIIGTNLLTKFHKDRKINVTSRAKNAPPPGGHVFTPTSIIIELIKDIIGINLVTKFHSDRTINVASRVLTRFYYSHIRKNAPPLGSHVFQANLTWKNGPPPGGHVFQPSRIIFDLVQDIIGMNLLTKKNAPPPGGHVFKATKTIFELIQDIIGKNLLTKFYYSHINKNAPPPGGHFHDDWTINVASTVLKRFYYSHIHVRKNAPTLGSHVFQAKITIFELIQDIIETNLPTTLYEDWK